MKSLKQDAERITRLSMNAAHQSGILTALADSGIPDPEKLQTTLELTSREFEQAALEVRKLCEKYSPGVGGYGNKPVLPQMEVAGFVEQFGYGWLHIQLNTLLPHCRYQTADWLSDTIRRLLDEHVAGGSKLPFFKEAMLVIDEHCGIKGRHIFDQDNKGYKAVSNAIKGRLIPDDDQHTLALALLSTRSELDVCHITLWTSWTPLISSPTAPGTTLFQTSMVAAGGRQTTFKYGHIFTGWSSKTVCPGEQNPEALESLYFFAYLWIGF